MATFQGEVFTTREAANYLGYAEDTVRRYVYRSLIRAEKFGNSLLITKAECDRFKREKRGPGNPTFGKRKKVR